MMPRSPEDFAQRWFWDWEFHQPRGENPEVICMVAYESKSDRWLRLWQDELKQCPFDTDDSSLFVSYGIPAEASCHLALGWPLPKHCIDLYAEFRNATNGLTLKKPNLLFALTYFGIPCILEQEKDRWRDVAIRGGPFSPEERAGLLEYCASDVRPLPLLLEAMLPFNPQDPVRSFQQGLQRGRFAKHVAQVERYGVPADTASADELKAYWPDLKLAMVDRINPDYDVYDGAVFKLEKFQAYLDKKGWSWPRTPTGRLSTEDDVFKAMANSHPELLPLKELRATINGAMRLGPKLAIGKDGRNRTGIKPFTAITSRNQPSNAEFLFGPAVWLRHLIKPSPGMAVGYCDYEQEEFGIAGALSGDTVMQEAYNSGDPYMRFAIQAGVAPEGATKKSHSVIRELFKQCVLAVQYGMGADGLATRIGKTQDEAQALLDKHHETYKVFWDWSNSVVSHVRLTRAISTDLGWYLRFPTHNLKSHDTRTVRNFLMQAGGSEILRLAICLCIEKGLRIIAPIHDALLCEGTIEDIQSIVEETRTMMRQASAKYLDGFELRTEAKIVAYPDRFEDPRGRDMWRLIMEELERVKKGPIKRGPVKDGPKQFELFGGPEGGNGAEVVQP